MATPEEEAAAQAALEGNQDESTEEEKERAKLQGWVPKDEFRGDPEQWKPAKEFLKFGEDFQPILKERLKDLETKLIDITSKFDAQTKAIEKFTTYHEQTEDRAYKKAIRDLKALQLEAVELGDKDKFTEIEGEIDKLEDIQTKPPESKTKEGEAAALKEFTDFVKDNDWYENDFEMATFADFTSKKVRRDNPTLIGRAFFEKVKEAVKEKFPERFGNQDRYKPPAVDGGGGGGGPSGKKKTYSDLPAEAKKACEDFIKEIPGFTKEQYLKDYEWD